MQKNSIAFFCMSLLIAVSAVSFAGTPGTAVSADTLKPKTFTYNLPDPSVDVMDSMFVELLSTNPAWRFEEKNYSLFGFTETDTPSYSNQVYAERVEKLAGLSEMPYTYNDRVQAFINLYVNKRRGQMSNMLGLSQQYFPMFEQELDKRGMPLELKYLSVIESALNTNAVSKAGATGLWQLMYGTGKLLGLKVDTYVDERRDPLMATNAAFDYLQQMYGIYGDWFLAIAAYNCGPGNVNKALRKAGGGSNLTFWDIYNYLPSETRGYVPAFIGASYAFEYHKEHNIKPVAFGYRYDMVDTIMITKKMKLSDLTAYLNMSEEELAIYNPSLKTKTIPGFPYPYPLRLPMKNVALYYANEAAIYDNLNKPAEPVYANNTATKTTSTDTHSTTTAAVAEVKSDVDPSTPVKISYSVKKGDNMGYISDWFDCSVADIKKWNGLKSTKIVPGQKLKIEVTEGKKDYYASINKMSLSEKQKLTGEEIVGQPQEKKEEATVSFYTVRPGDTLWSIAKKYPENTIEGLRDLNAMSKNETLKAGTKIKVVK